ncbi:MAG: D-glycero-alpha-D-manno-heptose-1,7-bisphosphate 7-phosphatase, partial [Bacteroidota bacterium]
MKKNKAIFLDRDGVINYEKNFILKPKDMELIPEAPEALRRINESSYLAIVVTNQSAVARNLVTIDQLHRIHQKLKDDLKAFGAYLDAIYYCPHHPYYNAPDVNRDLIMDCHCRKPKSGMLTDASKDMNIDLNSSFLIGDAERDIIAG